MGKTEKVEKHINIAICDDDRDVLVSLTKQCTQILLEKKSTEGDVNYNVDIITFDNPEELVAETGFDVILMDIDFAGEGKGIDAAKKLRLSKDSAKIIYITSYTQKYVQQIFFKPSNLVGFLIKPINSNMLEKCLVKALTPGIISSERKFIFSNKSESIAINYDSIVYFESLGHRIYIHTFSEVKEFYGKLDDIKNRLPENFLQCHKSYIVNMNYADKIDKYRGFCMETGDVVRISRFYYKSTKERFIRYMTFQEE